MRRPVDSVGVGDLSLLASLSEAPEDFEKRPDNRLLDFFLSPNMASVLGQPGEYNSAAVFAFQAFGSLWAARHGYECSEEFAPQKRLSATQGEMFNELWARVPAVRSVLEKTM